MVKQPPAGTHHEDAWPVSVSERVIQNSSRWGCAKRVGTTGVQGGADALLDHDEDQLGFVAGESVKAFDQLWDLVLLHHHQLTFWHAVPVHHNLLGQVVVHLHKTTPGEGVMCVNYVWSSDWPSCWSPTWSPSCPLFPEAQLEQLEELLWMFFGSSLFLARVLCWFHFFDLTGPGSLLTVRTSKLPQINNQHTHSEISKPRISGNIPRVIISIQQTALPRSTSAVQPVSRPWSHWSAPHWASGKWLWSTSGSVSWRREGGERGYHLNVLRVVSAAFCYILKSNPISTWISCEKNIKSQIRGNLHLFTLATNPMTDWCFLLMLWWTSTPTTIRCFYGDRHFWLQKPCAIWPNSPQLQQLPAFV